MTTRKIRTCELKRRMPGGGLNPSPLRLCLCALLLLSPPSPLPLPRRGSPPQATYCAVSAQQLPTITSPPPFDYSVTNRQSVCDRQQLLHNGNVELRDALRGFALRPFMVAGRFFALDPNTGGIDRQKPGLMAELLDEAARRGGFTWRDSFAVLPSVVLDSNRTYDELLKWSVETYDLSAGWWTPSVERMKMGAAFVSGWFDSSIILVGYGEEQDSKVNVFSFLAPFHWGVWLMIGVTIVVSGIVYWGLEYMNDDSDRQDLGHKPATNVFYSALSFTGHLEFQPDTNYARLFTFSLSFWALLTASAYTANLASFLVVENTPIATIRTVGDAVRAGVPLCILRSSQSDSLISQRFPNARLVHVADEPDLFLGVREGKCTFAIAAVSTWEEMEGRRDINPDCKLSWIGRTFRFQESGFTIKSDSGTLCTSLVRDVLAVHFTEMKEDGFIDRKWRDHLDATADIDCDIEGAATTADSSSGDSFDGDESAQLDLRDMGGLFILHFGLTAIAIIVAVTQKYLARQGARRANKEGLAQGGNLTPPSTPQDLQFIKSEEEVLSNEEGSESGSGMTHDLALEHDEQGQYRALYEEQSLKLAALSKQMKSVLTAVDELRSESTEIREVRGWNNIVTEPK